jgi:hypothetical protein
MNYPISLLRGSSLERGERRIEAVELEEMARLYNKPLDYFVKQ